MTKREQCHFERSEKSPYSQKTEILHCVQYDKTRPLRLKTSFHLLPHFVRLNLLLLALCVSKLPHINIVDFFITRSITSNKFVLSSLNQEIRLLAAFTFNRTDVRLNLLSLALCVSKLPHTRLLAAFTFHFSPSSSSSTYWKQPASTVPAVRGIPSMSTGKRSRYSSLAMPRAVDSVVRWKS